MILFLIGEPGVGKSETARFLSELLAAGVVYGGDVARKLAETDEEVRLALEAGERVPPEKMDRLMVQTVWEARGKRRTDVPAAHHVVVDGYPRYMEQLTDVLVQGPIKADRVQFVHLRCDPVVALKRRLARGRADDEGDLAATRAAWQRQAVEQMADYVRSRSPLHLWEVDTTDRTVGEVCNEIGRLMHEALTRAPGARPALEDRAGYLGAEVLS